MAHATPVGDAWAFKTRPDRLIASDPINHSRHYMLVTGK
jgi:hypothetical protein